MCSSPIGLFSEWRKLKEFDAKEAGRPLSLMHKPGNFHLMAASYLGPSGLAQTWTKYILKCMDRVEN